MTREERGLGLPLGLAHELGLAASLLAATLIVLLGGEFPAWMWLSLVAPPLSLALRERGVVVPAVSGTLLALFSVGAGVTLLLRGGLDVAVFAGGATLLGLLVARTLTRRTLDHDQQALLLSLILVFAGSVLNVGVSYIIVFVAFAVTAVWAMATRQLLAGADAAGMSIARARGRTDVITPLFFAASAGVSLAVLAAAALIFVSFPRIGFGELNFLGRRASQLPTSVGFGGNPRGLGTSTAVVARAAGVGDDSFNAGLYLRGAVYDAITLDAFEQTAPATDRAEPIDRRPMVTSLSRGGAELDYELTTTPMAGTLVMTLGYTTAAVPLSGGASNPNRSAQVGGRDRHDQLRTLSPIASPFRYRVRGRVAVVSQVPPPSPRVAALSEEDRARYVAVKDEDAAIRAVVNEALVGAAPDATHEQRAALLRTYLLKRFVYSLDGEVAGRDAPLRAFIVDVRRGHCELFAGAYALMLRMAGVPARVVGGFQGGAQTDDGSVVFQLRHAHAWVEWWQDGVGWVTDDATPNATAPRERLGPFDALIERIRVFWDDRVLDFAMEDQQSALRKVTNKLRGKHLGTMARGAFAGSIVIGLVVLLARRLRHARRSASRGDELARHIVAAAERLAGDGPARETETVRELTERHPHPTLRDATALYERIRYGGENVDDAIVRATIKALAALNKRT